MARNTNTPESRVEAELSKVRSEIAPILKRKYRLSRAQTLEAYKVLKGIWSPDPASVALVHKFAKRTDQVARRQRRFISAFIDALVEAVTTVTKRKKVEVP